MPNRIEDYAVIGNCETLALVGRDGSIDWLGLPRFDSAPRFCALLGAPTHGRWLIAPTADDARVTRRYRGNTLILETVFTTALGEVCLTDFMTRRDESADIVRLVRGLRGEVAMQTELIVRFDYGSVVPWVSREEEARLRLIAGSERLLLDTTVPMRGEDLRSVGEFTLKAGDEVSFVLNWSPSYRAPPPPLQAGTALKEVESSWSGWAKQFTPNIGATRSFVRS